ncbi:ferredoxin [Rubidibacter lacunae KORDI 51-2]|uniref:Ferredoxin n=1 Tax=Rubidibacter lacunae KORDI 51-2 TaxID=582515 RepID=U5DII6_9CHRO|nr:ferredoxin [Rubidibacter lacunae]ERN40752.1 ferredoxin [Rubidibacter lacunae KORDI 51-2]
MADGASETPTDLVFALQTNSTEERTGLEPELGGIFRDLHERSGFEPELGGEHRQKGVYVDELTCIGCRHCAHTAPNTFYIQPDYGRARAIRQDGDPDALVQEAIDTCPVDCIHWVDYTELGYLEAEREHQVLRTVGFPANSGTLAHRQQEWGRKQQRKRRRRMEAT